MSLQNYSPLLLLLVLLLFVSIPSISCHLSTVAISHVSNGTIVCALLPSHTSKQFDLNCTSIAKRVQRNYPPANNESYAAIAAGDGFLCALGPTAVSNESSMRWWEFKQESSANASIQHSKRLYHGPPLVSLSAGDTHVCGLQGGATRKLDCWRWPQLVFPEEVNFTDIAVGAEFVCGLLSASQEIRCFGNDSTVVGREPNGSFVAVAAGSQHACGISKCGELVCWGIGAPKVDATFEITSLALGENRTCALITNGTVQCWGENSQLPDDLSKSQFVGIEAKGNTLCGILMANYSLVCWGNEIFESRPMVFDRVLPGACAPASSCSCILADSANICSHGAAICEPCWSVSQVNPAPPLPPPPPPPPPPKSNSTAPPQGTSSNRRRVVIIAFTTVGLAVGLAATAICFILLRIYRNSGRVHDMVRLHGAAAAAPPPLEAVEGSNLPIDRRLSLMISQGHSSTIEEFPLAVLLAATNNFSDDHKIGSGSFGSVYRATLDDGRIVAIKRAKPPAAAVASTSHADRRRRDRDREAAFLSELALLSRVNHKNLVRLLGFCSQAGERVLVYEFMANGTLHDHLHKLAAPPLASWAARLRVALDAARGIEYLHVYAVPPIIHRDIKPSNILLDATWTAKVADFGLSLLSPSPDDDGDGGGDGDDTCHVSSPRAAGTVGYMDPQYYRLQNLTAKSDVYSFGVVLLELLTGNRAVHRNDGSGTPRNVVEYAVPIIEADDVHRVIDRRLPPPTPSEIEAVAFVGFLAVDCVSPAGRDRPTMTEIVAGLERAVAVCATPSSTVLRRSATARSI